MSDKGSEQGPSIEPLDDLEFDAFEQGLLCVARYFVASAEKPELQLWAHGYSVAAERWGEPIGFAIAHSLQKLVRALLAAKSVALSFHDPYALEAKGFAARDEIELLRMIHHMRRDDANQARDAVAQLTGGRMDPMVIRSGLSFASRFAAGARPMVTNGRAQALRLVT